jgi:peptidyl-prolyl cis-trans isomerase SurA
MTLRCYFLSFLSLAATGTAAWAQIPTGLEPPTAAGQTATGAAAIGQTERPVATDDGLNLRFADGIVAIAEDKVITVDDVRHEIAPYIQQYQREARNQEEFNEKIESLQDSIIQQLIDRVLIIKDFRKDEKRRIPDSFVKSQEADELANRFDGDRSKFLAYLRATGKTMKDYDKDTEEDIIYHYELQQQRRSQNVISPVRIEQFYKENKDQFYQEDQVYLRLIELTHANGETDQQLQIKAENILSRLRSGEKFGELARQLSEDSRRSKGGDWGWRKRSDMKPEFAEPVFALKKGETTEPIITSDGCFLLYVENRKYAGIQPLDQVRDQIEAVLSTQMTNASQEKWLERLRRDGYVKHF